MPYKDPAVKKEKHKAYSAKHYQKNKETVKAVSKANHQRDKAQWVAFKSRLSCSTCGFSHPAALDFHHLPGTKLYGINDLVSAKRFDAVYEEIKKCIVLCANCHRIHHYDENEKREPKLPF